MIGPVVNRSGTLILHDDARVAFRGTLTVGRPIEGLGKVAVAGRLRLGDKPKAIARIRVEGDLRFEQESSLEIELGGPDPGQFDALVVGGDPALDGTLVVRTNGNYVPKAGDRFEVLTAKQIRGNLFPVASSTVTQTAGVPSQTGNRRDAALRCGAFEAVRLACRSRDSGIVRMNSRASFGVPKRSRK